VAYDATYGADGVARAILIRRRKWTDERENLYEIVLWKVERNARHPAGVRYRLAFIRAGEERPAILYDNHHPKGHHRHVGEHEEPYYFVSARQLAADFLAEASALAGEVK
jgi:hypothetical protein